MIWWCALVVVCVVTSSSQNEEEWKLVQTTQGPVRGQKEPDGVFAFYNIPYATAPTGENKFMAPLPPPNWTDPFDAIDREVICPQALLGIPLIDNKNMKEDCLIANIYVPDSEEINLSVLVIIHGGAFQVGYGDFSKAKNLMSSKKLIVVNFNYRLGIHGFLCLGTKDVPGNAGMKDQVMMLRWIQHNIASFGGNPNDVTISGNSAGAAAADILILSKSAKGLFHKVIIESGASLAEFVMQQDPLENAKFHAKSMNFTNIEDINALEKFYKTASLETLTMDGFFARPDSTFVFSPCVERDTGSEIFLHDTPRNILKSGDYEKLPMLYGFTEMEGLLRAPFFPLWKTKMNEKFSDFLPVDLIFESSDEKERVAKQVKEFYFGENPVNDDFIINFVNFFTDVMFSYPAIRSARSNIESGNTEMYLYEYTFVDANTPFVPHTTVRGANHCAQTVAVLDGTEPGSSDESNITVEYRNMKKIMRELWHNFITTGKPVPMSSSLPSWPPAGALGFQHMLLDQKLELRKQIESGHENFWNNIYDKYYREPLPPSLKEAKPI